MELNIKTLSFCVQFKWKISVIRNSGFYQKIVALRINTSILEPETLYSVNERNTMTVQALSQNKSLNLTPVWFSVLRSSSTGAALVPPFCDHK